MVAPLPCRDAVRRLPGVADVSVSQLPCRLIATRPPQCRIAPRGPTDRQYSVIETQCPLKVVVGRVGSVPRWQPLVHLLAGALLQLLALGRSERLFPAPAVNSRAQLGSTYWPLTASRPRAPAAAMASAVTSLATAFSSTDSFRSAAVAAKRRSSALARFRRPAIHPLMRVRGTPSATVSARCLSALAGHSKSAPPKRCSVAARLGVNTGPLLA